MILLRRWHFIPKSGIVKLNTSILYSIALFLSKRSKTLKKNCCICNLYSYSYTKWFFSIKISCLDAIPKFDKSMIVNQLCYIACEIAKGFGLLVELLFSILKYKSLSLSIQIHEGKSTNLMMCTCCYKHQRELRVQDAVHYMKMGLSNKVDMAKSNITTIWTPVFE